MEPPPAKPRPPLPEGPFLVVGLARSGAAVARLLAERGERVKGCDAGHPEEAEGLAGAGVEVSLDVAGIELLDGVNQVVKSPGVPQGAPVIAAARERRVPVVGELEVAWRLLPNPFVGVTGTNGKTTTAELIGSVYRSAGLPATVAGNVGTPLASLAGRLAEEATVVCECSSFQLEDTERFAPECAVFLNFTPDHLDRHGRAEDYLAAKLRIFANQANEDVAVYDPADPALRGRDLGGCARRVAFCADRAADPDCAVALEGDVLFCGSEPLVEADEISLLGRHNLRNAAAAAAATLAMGIEPDSVREGLRSFPGVPHRLEPVAEREGVLFVNDSKATNVASSIAALESFDGGVHAILGGSLKGGDFAELARPVAERCRACYLIGEAAERLQSDLAPAAEAGVGIVRANGLEPALRSAAQAARRGEVVLLSPACASFDAYADFEQRGEHFRSLVGELP